MQKEVKKSWALFIGIGIMMIAHGLQMQVMGIRSVLEDFSVFTTGIFMSGYFVGYFVGSRTTPNFVSKVGHIRVFAAFASLASLSALIAVVYVNPFMWTISRFITAAEVNLFFLLETILGPIWVWMVIKEQPSNETIYGGIVIIITIAIHSLLAIKKTQTKTT